VGLDKVEKVNANEPKVKLRLNKLRRIERTRFANVSLGIRSGSATLIG
jgi:hypothetical protein